MSRILCTLVLVALVGVAGPAQSQSIPVQERITGRGGHISSGKELHWHFKDGYNLDLAFTERVFSSWFIEFRVGAIYMGDLLVDLDPPYFESFTKEMRILLFTLAPQYTFPLSDRFVGYVGAGAGIYTVSMLIDDGVQAGDLSDQHFGMLAHGGVLIRITESLNIDVSFAAHHIRAGGAGPSLFGRLTDGGENPTLLQSSVGLSLDLR